MGIITASRNHALVPDNTVVSYLLSSTTRVRQCFCIPYDLNSVLKISCSMLRMYNYTWYIIYCTSERTVNLIEKPFQSSGRYCFQII